MEDGVAIANATSLVSEAISGSYEVVLDDTGDVLQGSFTTEPPCEVEDYGPTDSCVQAP